MPLGIKNHNQNAAQAGNALFLILIAVILFAALSYAMTRSSRTGGPDITDDKAEVAANILINYTTQLRQAMTRMVLTDQLEWWEVDFGPDPTVYVNINCTTPSCKIFHPSGGGVPPLYNAPIQALKDQTTTSVPKIQLVIVENIGTSSPDIVLKILNLNKNVCDAVNAKMGISGYPILDTAGSAINLIQGNGYTSGGHSGTPYHIGDIPTGAAFSGKDMGCGCKVAACTNGSDYRFYAVIHQQ